MASATPAEPAASGPVVFLLLARAAAGVRAGLSVGAGPRVGAARGACRRWLAAHGPAGAKTKAKAAAAAAKIKAKEEAAAAKIKAKDEAAAAKAKAKGGGKAAPAVAVVQGSVPDEDGSRGSVAKSGHGSWTELAARTALASSRLATRHKNRNAVWEVCTTTVRDSGKNRSNLGKVKPQLDFPRK